MPGWGLVAMALLATGGAGRRAERVPCAEQRDWQSHSWSCAGGQWHWDLAQALPKNQSLLGGKDKTLQKGTFPLESRLETHRLTCLLCGLGEGQGKPQKNVGARARGDSQALYPTATEGC